MELFKNILVLEKKKPQEIMLAKNEKILIVL